MSSQLYGRLKNNAETLFFPILDYLPTVIFANATVLLRNSRSNFHCYTQREPIPMQKLAQKWQLLLLAEKITKGSHLRRSASLSHLIHSMAPDSLFLPVRQSIW